MLKFLSASLVIYALGGLSHSYYSESIDYMTLTDHEARIDWVLKAVRDLGLTLFVGGSIIWSLWSYGNAQNKRKAAWYIVFSLSLGLALSVGTWYLYATYSAVAEKRQPSLISSNPSIAEAFSKYLKSPDHPIQERHENSLLYGSTVFIETGKKIQIMDAKGRMVVYQPTAEDKMLRQKEVRLVVMEQYAVNSLKSAAIHWVIVSCASLVIGLLALGSSNMRNKSLNQAP